MTVYRLQFDGMQPRNIDADSFESAAIRAYWLSQHLLGPADSFDIWATAVEGPEWGYCKSFKLIVRVECAPRNELEEKGRES